MDDPGGEKCSALKNVMLVFAGIYDFRIYM
jgi:hypothetical protein